MVAISGKLDQLGAVLGAARISVVSAAIDGAISRSAQLWMQADAECAGHGGTPSVCLPEGDRMIPARAAPAATLFRARAGVSSVVEQPPCKR